MDVGRECGVRCRDFIKGRARVVVSRVVGGVTSQSAVEVAHIVTVLTVLMVFGGLRNQLHSQKR
jgi:hypothetical protein